jgi:hypothetical protein
MAALKPKAGQNAELGAQIKNKKKARRTGPISLLNSIEADTAATARLRGQ